MKKEFIFGADEITAACHASTILPLNDGRVLAAWFGGSAEGRDDTDIYVARRVGALWFPPVRISAGVIPHWNPVLSRRADGSAVLYFKVGKKIAHWQTYFCTSSDGGKKWTKPQPLVPGDDSGGRGPVKNKPLRLADGTLLAPASSEQGAWLAFIDISTDDGMTWTRTENIPAPRYRSGRQIAMIQPTLWTSAPNDVHALFRTNRSRVYRSDSADAGRRWCEAYPPALRIPNSGIDLARVPDGRLFLAHNPCGRSWGERTPLLLSVSEDNGETWREVLTLERRRIPGEEFSYPAVVSDGFMLHITYTYKRQKIVYWQILTE